MQNVSDRVEAHGKKQLTGLTLRYSMRKLFRWFLPVRETTSLLLGAFPGEMWPVSKCILSFSRKKTFTCHERNEAFLRRLLHYLSWNMYANEKSPNTYNYCKTLSWKGQLLRPLLLVGHSKKMQVSLSLSLSLLLMPVTKNKISVAQVHGRLPPHHRVTACAPKHIKFLCRWARDDCPKSY